MNAPNHVKLFIEYDRIRDGQILKELTNLYLKDEQMSTFLSVHNSAAYFKHYVGTIQTEHFTISILPKIWAKDDQPKENIMANLLRLLLYTYLPTSLLKPETLISPRHERNDLFELLILLYSITMERELNQGLYRRYISIEEESRYLRGKLNLAKQLNRLDKAKFDISDFRFSANNNMNRYFSYATTLFSMFTRDLRNLHVLSSIELLFQSESVKNDRLPATVNFNRLNDRFQIPYNYANLIINHMRPEPGNDKRAMMMLFNMNEVFQEFFVKFIEKNRFTIFPDCEVNIKSQYKHKNFIFDHSDALRFTIPDLWIEVIKENVKKTLVIDMKYKLMSDIKFEGNSESLDDLFKITQSDLYQMFTYSNLYKADGSVLVFPGDNMKLSKRYNFLKDETPLWIFMLRLDFSDDGWENKLSKDVRSKFQEIIASFNSE